MDRMIKSIVYLALVVALQSCGSISSTKTYNSDWATPAVSHSLLTDDLETSQIKWEQQFYVRGSVDKRLKCVSVDGRVILVGSPNSQSEAKIYALDGETGSVLWSFDGPGILANSANELFVANETTIYSIEPSTGVVNWEKQLVDSRNIVDIMYYDEYLYLNSTGIYTYYILGTDGQVAAKYTNVSDFRSQNATIPFYPDLPFGHVADGDVFIIQLGDALYSSEVYDNSSKELLWEVKRNSISNFIILDNKILWISSDDQLKIANKSSGNLLESVRIVPSIDFFALDIDKQHAGYYLCGNNKSKKAYVILGDSRQIFAFQLP